jgi:hypothetical protein
VSDRIDFSTAYREFQPGYAILTGRNALDYEVIEIAAVDANGIDLADPVQRPWPQWSRLLPLRKAQIEDSGDVRHVSAGVGTVTSILRFIEPNPWTPAVDASPTYLGRPVFLREPNWSENLSVNYDIAIAMLDNQTGVPVRRDTRGRVMLGQQHRWFLRGREELASFRDLIYRNQGRRGSFWLPTFKADLRLADDVDSTDDFIEIENVGFDYSGGPFDGREYLAVKHSGGVILGKIVGSAHTPGSDTETIELEAPVGQDLSTGQVRRISFMDTARFDQDDFEIVHYGGPDGLHEVNATFRTFKDSRTAPTPIHYPIPVTVERAAPCGEEEETCMIEFVVTLPEPMPEAAVATDYGEIGFRVNVDPSSEGPVSSAQIELRATINPDHVAYSWLGGITYPAGIGEFHQVSYFDHLGAPYPDDKIMYEFMYDSAANTFTVRCYTTVVGGPDDLYVYIVGTTASVGGNDLLVSVTQAKDGGDPETLSVYDAGTLETYSDAGEDHTWREQYFNALTQIPCGDDTCSEEIYNGPLVVEIPVTIPTITHDTYDSYLQVYMSLSVETPSGATRVVSWPGPSQAFINASASSIPTPNSPVTRPVYDPVCDRSANVTVTTELAGGVVTLTVEIDDPHFKFAPNWEAPDTVGDPNWWDHPYGYGDWVGVNIIGDNPPFSSGSFSTSATITLDGASGSPATEYETNYVAQASGPAQNGYRYRFVPSLT